MKDEVEIIADEVFQDAMGIACKPYLLR